MTLWTAQWPRRIREFLDRFGLYAPADAEQNAGFREEILRGIRIGLLLAGLLAVIGPSFSTSLFYLLVGHDVEIAGGSHAQMAHWDEFTIIGLGLLTLIAHRARWVQEWGRAFLGICVFLMNLALVGEAIVSARALSAADVSIPFTLLMLVTIGTVPMRARQALAIAAAMLASDALILRFLPGMVNGSPVALPVDAIVLMSMVTMFSCLIAAQRYAGRWRQYEARRQEQSMREIAMSSEQKFRSLFENSLDGIFIVDNATRTFVVVNPTFAGLLGVPAAELQGRPALDFVHPEDRDECFFRYECAIHESDAQGVFTFRAISPALQEPRVCEVTLHRAFDPAVTVGSVRDVTRRAQAETQLRAYASELERANEAIRETQIQLIQSEKMASLGHLVAGVAHEINTPLGSINSNADVAKRALEIIQAYLQESSARPGETLPDRVHQALDILLESNATTLTATKRIVGIVRSLRNFARLDEAELKEVDIHEGIESTLTLAYHEFKRRVEIVRDFGQLPLVWCYPNQINQVFMNILVNAIHAIPDSGTVTIRTRHVGDAVTVAFADTGVGIAPANLKRIFDPGFTTKGVGVGTGLGLSIVYKIIRAHEGTIDVESEEHKGSTFTVTLPIRGPHRTRETAIPAEEGRKQ